MHFWGEQGAGLWGLVGCCMGAIMGLPATFFIKLACWESVFGVEVLRVWRVHRPPKLIVSPQRCRVDVPCLMGGRSAFRFTGSGLEVGFGVVGLTFCRVG